MLLFCIHIAFGRLDGEKFQIVDEWSVLSPGADSTFRDLMKANNIALQPALVVATKAQEPVAPASDGSCDFSGTSD